MTQAANQVITAWLKRHFKTEHHVWLCIGTPLYSAPGSAPTTWLTLDFHAEYSNHVHLQEVCKVLDHLVPGLAQQLLATLAHVNGRVIDIFTPEALFEVAEHELWYSSGTDEELLEEHRAMGADEDDLQGLYRPSHYRDSLGPHYAALAGSLKDSSALLWTPEEVIEAVEGTPDWVRQIAQQLLRLRSTYDATSPIGELTEKVAPGEDHCCKYEPSVVFWWSPDDDMGRIYDDLVNDRYEVGSERWQEELLALPLRSEESIVPMVDWMEAAFPFMRAVGDLHDMLWEAQKLCK